MSIDNSKLSSKYIDNCTFVKTVLMILVVLGHSVNFWKGNWFSAVEPSFSSNILVLISDFVNSFHIYAFVIVSGYVYAFLRIIKGKYPKYLSFLYNKVLRLIIPFIFTCFIWVAPVGCYFNGYSLKECLNRYLLGISPNQLWFLLMLFWCFVFAWPLTKMFKDQAILSLGVVLVFYIVGIVGSHFIPNYYSIWTGSEYLLFFWLGFQIFVYRTKFFSIPTYVWIISYFILFISERVFAFSGVIASLLQVMIHLIGALMAFFTIQWLATKVDWKNSKLFWAFSKKSMPIYLFHQQFIYIIIIWLNGKVNPYFNAGLNFIVAMLAAFIVSSLLMKFKWTRFLIGEK